MTFFQSRFSALMVFFTANNMIEFLFQVELNDKMVTNQWVLVLILTSLPCNSISLK